MLFELAVGGRDSVVPAEYYIPYDDVAELQSPLRAKPMAALLEKRPGQQDAARKLPTERGADIGQ